MVGRFLLNRLYQLVAATGVREAMTASALLTVVGVALVMEAAGLSRRARRLHRRRVARQFGIPPPDRSGHRPFEGLLLGVFFIAVGMSMDLTVLAAALASCIAIVIGLVAIKATCSRAWPLVGIEEQAAVRLGLVISQGGEFAFVLFSAGVAGVIGQPLANLLTLAVTLSMAATPVLAACSTI